MTWAFTSNDLNLNCLWICQGIRFLQHCQSDLSKHLDIECPKGGCECLFMTLRHTYKSLSEFHELLILDLKATAALSQTLRDPLPHATHTLREQEKEERFDVYHELHRSGMTVPAGISGSWRSRVTLGDADRSERTEQGHWDWGTQLPLSITCRRITWFSARGTPTAICVQTRGITEELNTSRSTQPSGADVNVMCCLNQFYCTTKLHLSIFRRKQAVKAATMMLGRCGWLPGCCYGGLGSCYGVARVFWESARLLLWGCYSIRGSRNLQGQFLWGC